MYNKVTLINAQNTNAVPPTKSPTMTPTKTTESPTKSPTSFPTKSPTLMPTESTIGMAPDTFAVIVSVSIFAFLLIIIGLILYFECYKREKKSLYIKNGLVIVIGIGNYDQNLPMCDRDVSGTLSDLEGIEHDIKNMVTLFHDNLHFDVYPSEYLEDIKIHWTEQELLKFLTDKAKYLEENIEKYDGLIV